MFINNILGSYSNILPFTSLFDKEKIVKLANKVKASTPKNDSVSNDKIIPFTAKGKASAGMEASGIIFPTFFSSDMKSSSTTNTENTTQISGYKIDDQGDTNACGTTSLTSVLRHYGSNVKDHWQIDKDIRSTRFDMFTAPGSVIDYAKDKGFNAGMKNNGNIDDLVRYVDKGVPPMVLIDTTPENSNDTALHWEVVTGYQKDKEGKVSHLLIADPSSGSVETQEVESFKKEWNKVKLGSHLPIVGDRSIDTGYNNVMVVITPKNATVTAPDGTKRNTNTISIPHDSNPIPGRAAELLGKGARVLDDTINLEQKVEKKISEGGHYVAKKLENAEEFVEEKLTESYHFAAKKIYAVEKEVSDVVYTIGDNVSDASHAVKDTLSDVASAIENKVSNVASSAYDKVSSGISLVSGLFD